MNRLIAILPLIAIAPVALAQRAAPEAPDAYGYTVLNSADAACPYHYMDLDMDGQALTLQAAGVDVPAEDDGGATLSLDAPFEFYGKPVQSLVASSNGYLALGADGDSEDGGYWRADCRLPAIPDNRLATFARLYVLAGDLVQGVAGRLYAQHFSSCPRASGVIAGEACTVLQWRGFERLQQSESLDFQAVLYHQSWQMALQYRTLAGNLGTPALSIGAQDADARSAVTPGCAGAVQPAPASAICLFDPRFPPTSAPNDAIFVDGFELPPG